MSTPPRAAPPTLLERQSELTALDHAAGAAAAGTGRVVMIEAAAGLGKSRLVAATAGSAAAHGLTVLRADGSELAGRVPFALAQELLHAALRARPPEQRAALLDGRASAASGLLDAHPARATTPAAETLLALAWLLTDLAEAAPLAVLVDDAQWVDGPSVELLAQLARRAPELALLLVVAARPPAGPPEHNVIAALEASDALALAPRALSPAAATQLLRERLGGRVAPAFAAACYEATGGNPFYLGELARTLLVEGIPASARAVGRVRELGVAAIGGAVLTQLARLPDGAVAVARAVAVLDDAAQTAHVARLSGLDREQAVELLSLLTRADVLADRSPPAYRHAIVRAAVLAELTATERSEWEGRAAGVLWDHGAAPERVAAHLLVSQPAAGWEIEVLRVAAATVRARGAPALAARMLRRAADGPLAPGERAGVMRELGAAAFEAGEPDALEHLQAALMTSRGPVERARAALELVHPLAGVGRTGEAVELLRSAAAALDDDERSLRAELDAALASIGLLDSHVAAEIVAELSLRAATEPAGPADRRMLANLAQCAAMAGASADEAAALAERAVAGGMLVAEAGPTSPSVVWAALVLVAADHFASADAHLDAALEEARRRGSVGGFVTMSMMRSLSAYRQGDLAEAEAEARGATDAALAHGWGTGLPATTAFLVDALIERGDLDEAEAALQRAGIGDELPDTVVIQAYLVARGRLHLARGRLREGLADLLEVGRRAEGEGWSATIGTPTFRTYAVPALLGLDEVEPARAMAAQELALARAWGAPRAIAMALRVSGLAAAGEQGRALLVQAAATLADSPARLERARVLADLGAALRRAGRAADARDPLREAQALASACGAGPLAAFARDELAATGARRTARTLLRGVDALTPSERRVAQLAAGGLGNREIAQTLFLSRKTIEMHLSRAYRKLDIASRDQLAAALAA